MAYNWAPKTPKPETPNNLYTARVIVIQYLETQKRQITELQKEYGTLHQTYKEGCGRMTQIQEELAITHAAIGAARDIGVLLTKRQDELER